MCSFRIKYSLDKAIFFQPFFLKYFLKRIFFVIKFTLVCWIEISFYRTLFTILSCITELFNNRNLSADEVILVKAIYLKSLAKTEHVRIVYYSNIHYLLTRDLFSFVQICFIISSFIAELFNKVNFKIEIRCSN